MWFVGAAARDHSPPDVIIDSRISPAGDSSRITIERLYLLESWRGRFLRVGGKSAGNPRSGTSGPGEAKADREDGSGRIGSGRTTVGFEPDEVPQGLVLLPTDGALLQVLPQPL